MRSLTRAMEFIERIGPDSQLTDIKRHFSSFLDDGFGLASFTAATIKQTGRTQRAIWPITTVRDEWLKRYDECGYVNVDPVAQIARTRVDPYVWSEHLTPHVRKTAMMQEAGELGYRDGIVFPVHLPDGSIDVISIGTDKLDLSRQDRISLHIGTLHLGSALRDPNATYTAPVRSLTPREREVMHWVAAGKTDWEISQILSVAEITCRKHVDHAREKLGATTRAQAVVAAIRQNEINL